MKQDIKYQTQDQPTHKSTLSRRDFLSTSLKVGAAAFTTGLLPKLNATAERKYNVLFIMVDDLRPLLGCYGYTEMHTPNIDRLAQRGILFNRAYCQFPVCNPSRASILTGLRPESNGVQDNYIHYRDTVPDVISLPQHFKAHGYHTRSIGKIMHGPFDDEISWSEPSWEVKGGKYTNIPSWQSLDVLDDDLEDGKIAKHTTEVLDEIQDSLFFLAVGFNKPHMPFDAPTNYYELYEHPNINNVPRVVPHSKHELRGYTDIPSGEDPISIEKTLELIQGYKASTSYMDAQVGRVLSQLDSLGLTEKTVILFCGDHGFHLGEHNTWGKRTLFDVALRSPLIVNLPRQEHIGIKTDALIELVDIYPSLCDACQLPIPTQLEGISMVPIIRQATSTWKSAVFSKVGKEYGRHSIRTNQYRYTERVKNGIFGRELYDYNSDPDETVNMAYLPENTELVEQLRERLHAGWQAALPDPPQHLPLTLLPWDVNYDGVVDLQDLLLVSSNFGIVNPENSNSDVNKDGEVDIIDLLLIATHLGETSNASSPKSVTLPRHYVNKVEKWLSEARTIDDGSTIFREGLANLEQLLNTTIPKLSTVLPNFPNPFNAETWIPYDLSEDADVNIHIYNITGESVRHLKVGFQNAGIYRTQGQSVYWDGRNSVGDLVPSGVYFYTFQAGRMKATRKMVLRK